MSKKGRLVKSLDELKARAASALGSPALIKIAGSANSPTAAQELAYLETGDVKTAMACQYLAAIKRDYGKDAFELMVSSAVSNSPSPSDRAKRKGDSVMPKGTVSESLAVQMQAAGKQEEAIEVAGKDLPSIPLAGIEYRAAVNGAFARVRCIQKYVNDAARPVEAVYVFPLPNEASVVGCAMKIGDRKIDSVLKEKQQARQEYDQAVSDGHHASLLEQERPNIFTMNVGGIEPGGEIDVEVTYVQRIRWQDGGGRFAIPLVVAPRFIPGVPQGKTGGGWAPDTDEVPDASRITPQVAPDGVPYRADVQVLFTPGFWCELTSPSHAFAIVGGAGKQTVRKKERLEIKAEGLTTDRDFILAYRSLLDAPETAYHVLAGQNESFGMLTVVPPLAARPKSSQIVMLLDVSGSMGGAKLEGLKRIAKKVLRQLMEQQLGHQVAVVPFENDIHPISGLQEISESLIDAIDGLEPLGGTMTGQALTYAHGLFPVDSESPKLILLISDGQTNQRAYQGKGARIITAGIDSAINDSFLQELADQTGGISQWFYPGEDFDRAANTLVEMLSGPVLRSIAVKGVAEIIGSQDVFGGRPAMLLIRQDKLPPKFVVSGKDAKGDIQSWEVELADADECDFLDRIWAREYLRQERDAKKQLEISLKYGVICPQTSFVAISEKQVPGQKPIRVEVPVELPFTWDYASVFGRSRGMAAMSTMSLATLGCVSGGSSRKQMLSKGGGAKFACGPMPRMRGFGGDPVSLGGLDIGSSIDSMCFGSSGGDVDHLVPPVEVDDVELDLFAVDVADADDRFSLDAADPIDRLIAILIAVSQGRTQEAEAAFRDLKLKVSDVKNWTTEQLAKANYFVVRLAAYGLKPKPEVMKFMAQSGGSVEADAWKELVKREIGVRSRQPLLVRCTFDGLDYILWKLGQRDKPEIGPWALVP